MPIISSVTSSSGSTAVPQKADLKPIGICLPTNSSLDMSNSGTTLATNRVTTTSSTANYFNSSSSQSSAPSAAIPVGALSVMVARFSGDNNSRPQTVILHPRPISSGNRAALQMSASLRGSTVISGQTMSTTGSTPSLTSSSASISVRTTHLIGGQQHTTNALPVLNLSTVTHANTSGVSSHSQTTIKQICGQSRPFMTTSGALPIESVSLVMANPNESNVMNARPLRLHQPSNDLKPNTIHNINKISGPRTTLMTGTPLMTTQPTKMAISIGGSGHQTATTMSGQHVARVGIIGQLPMGSVPTTTANKSGIINLPKGHFIFNSPSGSTAINSGNTTLHNMVNVSHSVGGSVASFTTSAQSSQQTAKLSLNAVPNNLITTRHSVVSTTAPFISHNVSNCLQSSQHIHTSHRPIGHQNANMNSLHPSSQPQQLLPPTVSTTSPLRPTILSSPANSPIKQQTQLQASTPSSPRPSILIRKRPNDSLTGLTPTALFKTTAPNSAITGSSIPLRITNYGIKAHESLTLVDNRVNDVMAVSDNISAPNCTTALPTTPNSEGNQTPRKKPRKQLLEPSSLKSSQNMRLLNNSTHDTKQDICTDKESAVHVNRKPRVSLLSSYNMGWKSLQYHFLKYSDVRPKPEKKLTLSELSSEGLQRKNGWKIHHLAAQMEVMTDNEHNVYQRLHTFLDTFEKDASLANNQCCAVSSAQPSSSSSTKPNNSSSNSVCDANNRTTGASDCSLDTIAVKLNDLIRGNLQRSNLFSDQIIEAKQLIVKLTTDHKERVGKITKKCANKRTYITK